MDTVDGDLGANPTIVPISVEKQVKQSSKPSLLRRFRELRRGSSLSTQVRCRSRFDAHERYHTVLALEK